MGIPSDEKVGMDVPSFLSEWEEVATARGFRNESLAELGAFSLLASSKAALGGERRPICYLSAGIHGDEPAGPEALLALLKEGFFDERFDWLICPVLNPVGMAQGTRENARGIDLNRDYCLQKTKEVSAHIAWLERQEVPHVFLSLHEDWESSGFYCYEINQSGPGSWYEGIMEAVAPFFPPEPEELIDDHEVTAPGWIYHSEKPDIPEEWPEAIFLAKFGCPQSLTFETPSSAALEQRVLCQQAAVKEALRSWLL